MTPAQITLQHLGGNHFVVMTGAKDFVGGDGLMFSLPRGAAKNKSTKVRIDLQPNDTYRVTFMKWKNRLDLVEISKHEDVYADRLRWLFERETGLYTRL